METPTITHLMMEFLLELLKEERKKRHAAEQELKSLRSVLEPLQQNEMDRIRDKRRDAIENIRKQYYKTECNHGSDELVCDGGYADGGVDELDSQHSPPS